MGYKFHYNGLEVYCDTAEEVIAVTSRLCDSPRKLPSLSGHIVQYLRTCSEPQTIPRIAYGIMSQGYQSYKGVQGTINNVRKCLSKPRIREHVTRVDGNLWTIK